MSKQFLFYNIEIYFILYHDFFILSVFASGLNSVPNYLIIIKKLEKTCLSSPPTFLLLIK